MADHQTSDMAKAVQEVSERASLLVREEIALAKAEVTEKMTGLAKGAAVGAAAGIFILAGLCEPEEAQRWYAFGDRLIGGLLDTCDLTGDPKAEGLLAHGAAHASAGYSDAMLPYGDYYFMEALMRSLGHTRFFW